MDKYVRIECGKFLRNESAQLLISCLQCNCEFNSLELFVRHRTSVHGAIQLQSLQQKMPDEAIPLRPLRTSLTHGVINSQRGVAQRAINSQQLERSVVQGAIHSQQLKRGVAQKAVSSQQLNRSVAHGAVNSQQLNRSVALGAINSQQLQRSVAVNSKQIQRSVAQGAINSRQCVSVSHGAVKSHPLQQSGRLLPEKTRPQLVMKHSDAATTRTTLAKKSSPIAANCSSAVHGPSQLKSLQQKMPDEAIPLRPLHTSVEHGAIDSQQFYRSVAYRGITSQHLDQSVAHRAITSQQLERSVAHGAVKSHPLQQSGRILPEKTRPQVAVERSDAATTFAKKSSPIPENSSSSDESILPGKFKCKKCQKKFDSLRCLDSHTDNCKPLATISCDYCPKTYRTLGPLRNHLHRVHKSEMPFVCDACPRSFNLPSELTLHRRTHGTATIIRCDFCDERFTTKFERTAHVRRDHANDKYRCSKCFFESKVMGVVKRHQSVVHGI